MTNYTAVKGKYLYGQEALATMKTAPGFIVKLFGGFFRYNPVRRQLERTAQLPIPKQWIW
ncbi:MAG: hypothetical protein IPP49_18815 [Saprospiraceae bacterium]|nr:hypothetical protein [Saprospiraceae bacterium]